MEFIQKFNDFINEEINFERISETECYLTRRWYYYNAEDDIIYGCDSKPEDVFTLSFENNQRYGKRLFVYETLSEKFSVFDENYEINGMTVGEAVEFPEKMDMFFERDEQNRYILLSGTRLVATSFDIIEEN